MQVTADIHRSDIVWLNIHTLFRIRFNYLFFLFISLFTFISIVGTRQPANTHMWIIAVVSSVIAGLSGLLVAFLFSLATLFFSSSTKNGVLGRHVITLTPEGIHESTSANESLYKWSGTLSVQRAGQYIFFGVAPCLFLLIPRKAFATQDEFDTFFETASQYFNQSQT